MNSKYRKILLDNSNTFIISAIVLAEIKYLIAANRIGIDFKDVIEHISECDNCIVYPVDEDVVENMPEGLEMHDAIIMSTGLVHKSALGVDVMILTEDEMMKHSAILPVA